MRRSPFYAYPSYSPFFAPSSAHYSPHHGPFPFSASPSAFAPTTNSARPVINIPVHDSSSPVSVRPAPKSSPATARATPLLDPASAAIIIQSCFRGFCIRRHHPLLHLRFIAEARKQLEELELELQNPGFSDKVRASDKERLRFSESVMAVILRLDAIQGSIPEVRSQRKEATKMAIKLQDAIDAIMMQQVHEISDSKLPTDGTLSDAGMAQENYSSECEQIEESLICDADINMAEEVMPTMLEGGQMLGAALSILEGPTFSTCDMARECSMALAMDVDKSDVVDEGARSLALLEAEAEVVDSGKVAGNRFSSPSASSSSHDASAEAHDAADHEMYGDETTCSDATCTVEGVVDSSIHSGCAETNSNIVQENMQPVAIAEEGVCEDDDTVAEDALGKDAVADHRLHTFMGVGQEHAEGFCPGTDDLIVAAEKLGHRHYSSEMDAPSKLAPDQLCHACTPHSRVQGAAILGDSLLEKPSEHNCSSHGTDPLTTCSPVYEQQGDPQTPTVPTVGTSDRVLVQQLSEDCRQLKSLLDKVLAHSKAQSKVICALGVRLEMLEHQQQLSFQNNRWKACEKRKRKRGLKRSGKFPNQ